MPVTEGDIARAALALAQNMMLMLVQKKVFTPFEANELFEKAVLLPFASDTVIPPNSEAARLLREIRDSIAKGVRAMDSEPNAPKRS